MRYESVITALIGAVLGTCSACSSPRSSPVPLAAEGFQLSFPVGTLVILLDSPAWPVCWRAITPAPTRLEARTCLEALAYE